RFDRVVVDKKVDNRDTHLKELRRLVKQVKALDADVHDRYAAWRSAHSNAERTRKFNEFQKADQKLQRTFGKFFYKQKVLEEMALVADNIHEKIQASLKTIHEFEKERASQHRQVLISGEQKKITSLEEFVRMPAEKFLDAYKQLK